MDEFLLPSDAETAKHAFETFRRALLVGNQEQVMGLMNFPANFVINGYPVRFGTSQKFANEYHKVFTRCVIRSVRKQKSSGLLGGWDGVKLSNGAVTFIKNANGEFRISDVRPKYVRPSRDTVEFLEHRLTCPPTIVDGRILAYNWVSHRFPGTFENIYIDHFIVEATHIVAGSLPSERIRVDFWGVKNLPEYNLPETAFEPGHVWRMYLRPAAESPANEVCSQDVQESISFTDEAGRELEKQSAITVITGKASPTYRNLPCFEVNKQFFSLQASAEPNH